MQIFVCHFRAESPTEDSMDTNEYLFSLPWKITIETLLGRLSMQRLCYSAVWIIDFFACESCCSGSWEWTLKNWRRLSQWEKSYLEPAFNLQYCFWQKKKKKRSESKSSSSSILSNYIYCFKEWNAILNENCMLGLNGLKCHHCNNYLLR